MTDKNGIPSLGELHQGWSVKLNSKTLNRHLVEAFGEGAKGTLKLKLYETAEEFDPEDEDFTDDNEYVCPTCDGEGQDEDGDVCQECSGSGIVKRDDDDDDDGAGSDESCDECNGCEDCTKDECCEGDPGGTIVDITVGASLNGKSIGDNVKGFKGVPNVHAFHRFINVLAARYEW